MTIKPFGENILVDIIHDTYDAGPIVIPENVKKEQPSKFKILTLGTGGVDRDGNPIVFEVKPGQTVIATKYAGSDIKGSTGTLRIIKNSDILAILEEPNADA